MPVDNELYNAPGDIWWDDSQALSFLRIAVNPARFGYFEDVLLNRLGFDPSGKKTLDIGSGGGLLAEEFARLGCRVTGIDPSEASLITARSHAEQSGLDIAYLQATGEDLPFEDETFDIVYCCDVLEHVNDLDLVIAETARVLKPGGIYLYDTINRTFLSKLILIKAAQEWKYTRMVPPGLHDWAMFITPSELHAIMARHGLGNQHSAGMKPAANPLRLLQALGLYKAGRIPYRELSQRLRFTRSRLMSLSYMGYAIKDSSTRLNPGSS